MSNEFLSLVSSPLMNLDHTYRYSGTKLVESESLSQHIIDTIMMGLKIIDNVNELAKGVEKEKVLSPETYLMKAVYHDLEEVITGDIPRPLKYYDAATLSSMRCVADNVALDLFTSEFHNGPSHFYIWRDAKEDPEGYILKLVDNLVVVYKVVKEVTMLHNLYMLKVAHEVIQYTTSLKASLDTHSPFISHAVNSYLTSLFEGAIKTLQDILDTHEKQMNDLLFSNQSMI